jgi:hypothetical protein
MVRFERLLHRRGRAFWPAFGRRRLRWQSEPALVATHGERCLVNMDDANVQGRILGTGSRSPAAGYERKFALEGEGGMSP